MNVLSLFDGKSSGYTALELAGIPVTNYYSSEIDKYAIQVSNAIHPNQTRLGDVMSWHFWQIDWSSIDLVLGGFPCQAWSMAGKQLGDKDERGKLFWYMLDVMKYVLHHNLKVKFLIENVKMKKEFEQYITHHTEQSLGKVEKHLINSALVSAQNRNRYYWTNIKGVEQPEDKNIILSDIIERGCVDREKSRSVISSVGRTTHREYFEKNQGVLIFFIGRGNNPLGIRGVDGKTPALTANSWEQNNFIIDVSNTKMKNGKRTYQQNRVYSIKGKSPALLAQLCGRLNLLIDDVDDIYYRKATPRECFRLQTVPEHYIDKILNCGVSNSQLYKIAGNGWTDEVIAHIFSFMKA